MSEPALQYAAPKIDDRQRISLRNQINTAIRNWQHAEGLWHKEANEHSITKEKLLAARIYGAVVTLLLLAQSFNIIYQGSNP
jgi:hypothetical protein